jgi:hypothetical protein
MKSPFYWDILVIYGYVITIWLFNIAMEDGLFIDGLPIKNGVLYGTYHGMGCLPTMEGKNYR